VRASRERRGTAQSAGQDDVIVAWHRLSRAATQTLNGPLEIGFHDCELRRRLEDAQDIAGSGWEGAHRTLQCRASTRGNDLQKWSVRRIDLLDSPLSCHDLPADGTVAGESRRSTEK